MRKLEEVIKEAIKIEGVPPSLIESLVKIKEEHLPWCPPENAGIWWKEAQIFINAYLPQDPKELVEWQKKFLKVWTGKDW